MGRCRVDRPTLLSTAVTFAPNVAAAESRWAATGGQTGNASTSENYFAVDPVFLTSASMQPYQRTHRDPLYRPLKIYTLDAAASRVDGAVATLNVPFEPLGPGPTGRVHPRWSIGMKQPGRPTSGSIWMTRAS